MFKQEQKGRITLNHATAKSAVDTAVQRMFPGGLIDNLKPRFVADLESGQSVSIVSADHPPVYIYPGQYANHRAAYLAECATA